MMEDKTFATELDQHLNSLLKLDVDTVFNVIYNALVSWVHKTNKDVGEYQVAYDKYIGLTRVAIRRNNYPRSPNKTHWSGTSSKQIQPKNWNAVIADLVNALIQMPSKTAIIFLSELTGAWCLSCSRESAKQYIYDENISDVDLADTLFSWLLRPFDYFG
ncbi:MAG: hypothetical protein ABI904_07565 [Chloroflexota bacterium]